MSRDFTGFLIPHKTQEPMRIIEFSNGGNTPQNFMESEDALDVLSVSNGLTWLMENEDYPGEINERASLLYNVEMERSEGFSTGALVFGNVIVCGAINPETGALESVSSENIQDYESVINRIVESD